MRWPGSCARHWAQAKIHNSKKEKTLEDAVQAALRQMEEKRYYPCRRFLYKNSKAGYPNKKVSARRLGVLARERHLVSGMEESHGWNFDCPFVRGFDERTGRI
jgi:hypothetical protein